MNLKIALVQTDSLVGNIAANFNLIIETVVALDVDLIVFPELMLAGYPPEDLLFRRDFIIEANNVLFDLANIAPNIGIVLGFPEFDGEKLYNSAVVLSEGSVLAVYRKQKLPNYSVFDEIRYFTAGEKPCVFEFKGQFIGLNICEDVWHFDTVQTTKDAGAEILLTLNASPFHSGKAQQRETLIAKHAKAAQLPIVYVNAIGGQDELVFDGASFVMNADGEIVFRAEEFIEQISVVEFENGQPLKNVPLLIPSEGRKVTSIYKALVRGTKDYVRKNGFKGAILGLSGGIDSALVLAIAVDALGAENVEAVSLPSKYTLGMSNDDAKTQAEIMGVKYHSIPIEPAVNAFTTMLAATFENTPADTTEENIQARCRGVVLMAMSNKQGKLLLTTGNKSEMSVGYATLYGDMCGGFAPIKDVPKLLVYELARYRNSLSPVIPERVLTRPPSAELSPNQCDSDSLPPYEILDPILARYVEQDQSMDEIIAAGFSPEDVKRVISLVDRSEYKRRQSAIGIRISERAFGRDRRYPVTSGYRGTQRSLEC
ncbi:MAG: NAD+ synthase [Methylococcales bacterium]|nr:NAD+ synthase [Methylococcales bacterium]MDD5753588.1 NAD+ synthase [Methylococcales bacterium]